MNHEISNYTPIIDRLNNVRGKCGLSVKSLAIITGLNQYTLTKYLNKELNITAYRTAFILGEATTVLEKYLNKGMLPIASGVSRSFKNYKIDYIRNDLVTQIMQMDAAEDSNVVESEPSLFDDESPKQIEEPVDPPRIARHKFYFYLDDDCERAIHFELLRRSKTETADKVTRRTIIINALKEYFTNN